MDGPGEEGLPHIGDLRRLVRELTAARLAEPKPELGGLTPEQLVQLVLTAWHAAESPLRLSHELELRDLESATLFLNCRMFLTSVATAGDVRATQAGNLNRAFVSQMLEQIRMPEKEKDLIRKLNRALNEECIGDVHTVRVVCECAGLVRRVKGRFRVVKKRQYLLPDEKAGELFRTLFIAYFQRFNMAYRDGFISCPGLQRSVAYSLYRLRDVAREWIAVEGLGELILLPPVLAEMEEALKAWGGASMMLCYRLLQPLRGFGLLDVRVKSSGGVHEDITHVRVSRLFERFLSFAVD